MSKKALPIEVPDQTEATGRPPERSEAWFRENLLVIRGECLRYTDTPDYASRYDYGSDDRDMTENVGVLVEETLKCLGDRCAALREAVADFLRIWDAGSRDRFLAKAVEELRDDVFYSERTRVPRQFE